MAIGWAGCQCGPTSQQDGGTSGGAVGGGAMGGGSTGGGGGVSGGGTGGGMLSCTVTPGNLPLTSLCDALSVGARGMQKSTMTTCGEPIRDSDVAHFAGIPSTVCGADGGFFSSSIEKLAMKIDAGVMAYDPVAAHACQALGRMNGGRPGLACPNDPCSQVFRGLVGAGGACEDSEDCAGAMFCQPTGELSCSGRCVARLGAGTSCDPDRDLCERGNPCLAVDGGFRCKVRQGVGGRCADAKDCEPGLGCAFGACAVRQAAGAACTDTTTHGDCLPDLGCVRQGTTTTCQPRANLGASCSEGGAGAPPCVATECVECVGGRCIAAGIEGAPCALASDCREAYFCGDGGTCVFRARSTEPCQRRSDPRGSCLYPDEFCSSPTAGAVGTCRPSPRTGEACGTTPELSPSCVDEADFCRITSGQRGTCAKRPIPPEACGFDAGLSTICREGKCVGGSCVAPTAPGTPCLPRDANCRNDSFCDDSSPTAPVCALKRASGSPCTDSVQCVGELCDRTTQRCSVACSSTFDKEGASCASGCPNGLRDAAQLLLFSMVLGPFARRRRSDEENEAP